MRTAMANLQDEIDDATLTQIYENIVRDNELFDSSKDMLNVAVYRCFRWKTKF